MRIDEIIKHKAFLKEPNGFFWVIMPSRSRPEIARIEHGLAWPTIGHGEPVSVGQVNILSAPLTLTRGLPYEE